MAASTAMTMKAALMFYQQHSMPAFEAAVQGNAFGSGWPGHARP
jgi:hypothetical protein